MEETWVWSLSGLGRSPGRGHGNPLQFSDWRILWQRNLVGWQSTVTKSWTPTEPLHSILKTKNIALCLIPLKNYISVANKIIHGCSMLFGSNIVSVILMYFHIQIKKLSHCNFGFMHKYKGMLQSMGLQESLETHLLNVHCYSKRTPWRAAMLSFGVRQILDFESKFSSYWSIPGLSICKMPGPMFSNGW